jgi:threonine dehydrogenase-like Zn-dependent dehydrogenase
VVRTDALLLDRDLVLRSGRLDVPEPRPGQVLVRVEWAGVCGWDLHVLRTGDGVGSWPARLGHEVAGTVADCPGGELRAGSPVVIDPRGGADPGGFAGHVLTETGQAVACPDDLEMAIAVLAEPLAVAMHALGRARRQPRRAAILGYGPIGALVHLEIGRRWPGSEVAVAEPVAARRELATALGAAVASRDELARWGPELVVDAAGYPGSLAGAAGLCADGGTVLAVALGQEPVQIDPGEIARRELTVTGSMEPGGELQSAVAVLAADPGRYRPVITDAVLLDEAPGRLPALLGSPAAGKVLIRP